MQGIAVNHVRPHGLTFDSLRPQYPAAKLYHLPVDDKMPHCLAIAYKRPQHLTAWSHSLVVDRHCPMASPSIA